MTRFARAKGSKASNERKEEEATPWHVMRQQLVEQLIPSNLKHVEDTSNIVKNIGSVKSSSKEVWNDFNEQNIKNKNPLSQESKLKKRSQKKISYYCEKESLQREIKKRKLDNISSQSVNDPSQTIYKIERSTELKIKKGSASGKNKKIFPLKNEQPKALNESTSKKSLKKNTFIEEVINNQEESKSVGSSTIQNYSPYLKRKSDFKVSSKISDINKNNSTLPPVKFLEKLIKHCASEGSAESNAKKDKCTKEKNKISKTHSKIKFKNLEQSKVAQHTDILNQNLDTNISSHVNSNIKDTYKKSKQHSSIWHNNEHTILANGRQIKVVSFEGFLIKKDDANDLKKLRKKLRSENIPKERIQAIMKLERRKAEKSLAREKNRVCFQCRKFGHNFADCPEINGSQVSKTGMCFKCGSMEHTHFECKVLQSQNFCYAVCFVCKEQGHIARQCKLNSQGQYPKGGSCHLCGEVTHLRRDCPKAVDEKPQSSLTIEKLNNNCLEDISELSLPKNKPDNKTNKVVKY